MDRIELLRKDILEQPYGKRYINLVDDSELDFDEYCYNLKLKFSKIYCGMPFIPIIEKHLNNFLNESNKEIISDVVEPKKSDSKKPSLNNKTGLLSKFFRNKL